MKQSNKLETYGNEVTMNMNNILYQNIQASPYFKQLYEKKTYHEVIDEIYNHVESLEPFLKGTTASTAFCLLYKLWTLRLSVKQVKGLIDHTDSPHIRALGFLYLRYVCKPADLWEWFEPYLDDEEEIQIQGGSRPVIITMGKVARQLLLENKWLGTILPRIPVPIAREIEQKIKEQTKPLPTPQGRQSPSYDNGRRDSPERNGLYNNNQTRSYSRSHSRSRSGSRTRSRTRSRERSSRSHRYRDYEYRRDKYREKRSKSKDGDRSGDRSRDRHRRRRSHSRDRRDRNHESRGSHDYEKKRRHDDDREPDRRRSRSPQKDV